MTGFFACLLRKLGFAPSLTMLDISCVLDGRIVDICETNFVSGQIVMPAFFIKELNDMARSKDPIKRAKGKRGLDVLEKIKTSAGIKFAILNKEVKGNFDNHEKLVELAHKMRACVVTTDFSITKLGALKNIRVLNITDLAIALKPVVLPGEEIQIFIMKEGKDRKQGVGYLDDGTMAVVEEGSAFIGKRIAVLVQSILQTSQGRIIFTKIRSKLEE